MEFFEKNAPAVIAASAALIGALIAGIFALINVIFNAKVSKDTRDSQISVEKWKANRNLFIEKGEEAMTLVGAIARHYQSFCTTAAGEVAGGEYTGFPETVKSILIDKDGNNAIYRLDTLLTAYFPELISDRDSLTETFNSASKKYFGFCMGKGDRPEVTAFLMERGKESQVLSREINKKLSIEISKHI